MIIGGLSTLDGFKITFKNDEHLIIKKFSTNNYKDPDSAGIKILDVKLTFVLQAMISILLITISAVFRQDYSQVILLILLIIVNISPIIYLVYKLVIISVINSELKQWHFLEHQILKILYLLTKNANANEELNEEYIENINPYNPLCSSNKNITIILIAIFLGVLMILFWLVFLIDLKFIILIGIFVYVSDIVHHNIESIFKLTQRFFYLKKPTEEKFEEAMKVLFEILKFIQNNRALD